MMPQYMIELYIDAVKFGWSIQSIASVYTQTENFLLYTCKIRGFNNDYNRHRQTNTTL